MDSVLLLRQCREKCNPAVFGSWMNISKSVDQWVLWLSDVGEIAKSNLRKEADGRGVDPDPLVFARRVASSRGYVSTTSGRLAAGTYRRSSARMKATVAAAD
ncbi:hypothetical protein [Bradyrhizobium sp. WSM471]|uniref:hypothetical protein n=1 Tax=Bradyrhizobium sp. WSM471 TaxID=319017 RepID=UPI0012FA5621|nr:MULTISPECIES: hypothetical protein [Bradyrhizobium]UFW39011.1 hypothetical protein BcanWSM471_22630 [Bradyrhizobium canariense]